MLKPIATISRRGLLYSMRLLAVLVIVAATTLGYLLWKVSDRPVSIGWAKDYVENALSNRDENLTVTFDDMVFSWPDLEGPFQLDLTGLRVRQGNEEASNLRIDRASVGLSRRALLIGLVRPVSVIVKGPSLELVRGKDGRLSFFFQGKEEDAEPERPDASTNAGEEVAQVFRDMARNNRGKFLSRLDRFEIDNASVAIRDYKFGLSWYLTGLNFRLQEEQPGIVSAMVQAPMPGGRSSKGAALGVQLVYRSQSDTFFSKVFIREINPYILSRFLPVPDVFSGQDLYFTGGIEAILDNQLLPKQVKLNGAIPEGQFSMPEEFDAPVSLKDIHIEAEYSDQRDRLAIRDFSGVLGGISFAGKGTASVTEDRISLPVEMKIGGADRALLPPLFPKSEQDGQAYKWIADHIQGGRFKDVSLVLQLDANRVSARAAAQDEAANNETPVEEAVTEAKDPGEAPPTVSAQAEPAEPASARDGTWNVTLPVMKLAFGFEDASVRYHDTLMPAENASGRGMLDLTAEILEIAGGSATIGDMQGENVGVKVTGLMTTGGGHVTVNAGLKGPMRTALDYIAAEPIGMNEERTGIDPSKAEGTVDAALEVSLPTTKDVAAEEVAVTIDGTMSDLNIPDVVSGLTLGGGPLAIKTEPGGFAVTGDAKLDGRDATIAWRQYFETEGNPYSMRIEAGVTSDEDLRRAFGVDLDDYITGPVPVKVVYTNYGDRSDVEVEGDLTPATIGIRPFGYAKAAGVPGTLSAVAKLEQGGVLKEVRDIAVNAPGMRIGGGKIGFAPRGGKKADIDNGTFQNAQIGKTEADVTFKTQGGALVATAKASTFDMNPFLGGTEASDVSTRAVKREKQQPMKITLNADTMLLKNDQTAKGTRAYVELDSEGDITRLEYDAGIGKGRLSASFRPDERGVRAFRLNTADAGSVLYAFGVYENVVGGRLVVYGAPKGSNKTGDLYGSLRMEDFRVVKAPALARLLSLMSLSGVGQALGSEGIAFTKLESGFEWRFRPEGNLLIIKDGKTSGAAVGLTFSGVMDRGRKTTDIAGTIIPISGVNTLLAKIPVVGTILGGASGLIAATYSIKGPTGDPGVSVNPLSVLAPGIIRRILFEDGYESKIPDDAPVAPASQVKAPMAAPSKGAMNNPSPKAIGKPAIKTN